MEYSKNLPLNQMVEALGIKITTFFFPLKRRKRKANTAVTKEQIQRLLVTYLQFFPRELPLISLYEFIAVSTMAPL